MSFLTDIDEEIQRLMSLRAKRGDALRGAFSLLPVDVAEEIGFFARRGKRLVKVHLAVLAGFCWYAGRSHQAGERVTVDPSALIELNLDARTFWVSIRTIARNLYERIHLTGAKGDAFEVRYARIRQVASQLLEDGWIRRVPHQELDGRRGASGSLWTFVGTRLESVAYQLPPSPWSEVNFTRLEVYERDGLLDCVGATMLHLLKASDVHGKVVEVESCNAVSAQRRSTNGIRLIRRVSANPTDREWHRSVGMFWNLRAKLRPQHVVLPYVVFDIDAGPRERRSSPDHFLPKSGFSRSQLEAITASYEVAKHIAKDLIGLGCSDEHLLISYTGGSGFHVHLPCGALGNPVFRNEDRVAEILHRFSTQVFGEEEYEWLLEAIDESRFAPRNLIRVPNSYRLSTGLYAAVFTAKQIRGVPLVSILDASRRPRRVNLPDPREVATAPPLAELLRLAAEDCMPRAPSRPRQRTDANTGPDEFFDRACEGCAESELWWRDADGVSIRGRNNLLFHVGRIALQKGHSLDAALDLVRVVNHRNRPPVDETEVKGILKSLKSGARKEATRTRNAPGSKPISSQRAFN